MYLSTDLEKSKQGYMGNVDKKHSKERREIQRLEEEVHRKENLSVVRLTSSAENGSDEANTSPSNPLRKNRCKPFRLIYWLHR